MDGKIECQWLRSICAASLKEAAMSDPSDASPAVIGGPTERWWRLPLALRTTLLCFAVIALTGAAVAVFVWSLRSPEEYPATISRLVGAVVIAAFVVGVVAARRGRRAWLAGYAGAVLAGIPIAVVHDTLVTGAITLISGSAVGDVIVFAVLTGLAFLAAGLLTLVVLLNSSVNILDSVVLMQAITRVISPENVWPNPPSPA